MCEEVPDVQLRVLPPHITPLTSHNTTQVSFSLSLPTTHLPTINSQLTETDTLYPTRYTVKYLPLPYFHRSFHTALITFELPVPPSRSKQRFCSVITTIPFPLSLQSYSAPVTKLTLRSRIELVEFSSASHLSFYHAQFRYTPLRSILSSG